MRHFGMSLDLRFDQNGIEEVECVCSVGGVEASSREVKLAK